MAHDGRAPLLHEVGELGVLAVVGHPARRAQSGERLAGPAPTVARDGTDEGGLVEGRGGEWIGRPEGGGVVDLFGPDGLEDGFIFDGIEDVFAEDTDGDDGADADEVVLRVEVVKGAVLRAVELGQDQMADVFGVGEPAGFVAGFAEGAGHCGKGDAAAVDRGGEVRAEARHGGVGRALARVGVGAAVGDALPARAVVHAGVIGAESLDQAGLARVAVLAQPRVPARA